MTLAARLAAVCDQISARLSERRTDAPLPAARADRAVAHTACYTDPKITVVLVYTDGPNGRRVEDRYTVQVIWP